MLIRRAQRAGGWIRSHDLGLTLAVLLFMLVFVFFWSNIVISIHSGESGVMWSRIFGTATDRIYQEGTHLIFPWNTMTVYNVRYQKVDGSVNVLSRDGLEITVELSVRFRPIEKLVGRLHQEVGPDYANTVIIPEVYAATRAVVSRFRPEELYTASFLSIQDDVTTLARSQVRPRYALIDDVQIRKIVLPAIVATAIQRKLEEEQRALEMQYRLAREQQEAERKRVEAGGIRDFQQLVASTLSDQLLQYQGIRATLELAQSQNAKIIVIGGRDGLPIILNADTLAGTPSAPARRPQATPTPAAPAETPSRAAPAGSAPAQAERPQNEAGSARPPQ